MTIAHRHARRRVAVAAIATAAAVAIAGCTAPEDTGSDADGLTVAIGDSITNVYPGIEAGVSNYWVANATAEGLVTLNPDGSLAPALATSWEQVDPLTYVYELTSDAMFQDGQPVTVEDVLASIEAARDPEISPSLITWGSVDTVEQTGDWELTITLSQPDASFAFGPSASAGLFVFPAEYWAASSIGTADSLPVGSGPYALRSFSPDSSIVLERSEHWTGEAPEFETITVQIIPDSTTRRLAVESGEVDLALSVPIEQVADWEGSDDIDVTFTPNRSYVGIDFDVSVAPFDDQQVRDAVAHAFDRQAVVDQVLSGHGEVATALLMPAQLEAVYSPEEARALLAELPQYPFDLDAAAASLAASGYPDGFTAELVYPDGYADLALSAELLTQNLAEIGVTLETRSATLTEWFSTMGDRVHGIGFMSYFSTTGDPAELTNWFLGPENPAALVDPAIDEQLAAARAATSTETQLQHLIEANRLQAEVNAYAPLWWGEQAIATDGTVAFSEFTSFVLFSPWPLLLERVG